MINNSNLAKDLTNSMHENIENTHISPRCLHFDVCSGCSMQDLNNTEQIKIKTEQLINLIKEHASIEPKQIAKPICGPSYNYRNKARLSCKYVQKKGKVLVGFREKNGRYVADIESCSILHPWFDKNILTLAKLIEELSVKSFIPQIEVSCGDKDIAIIIRHLKPFDNADVELLNNFSITHNIQVYTQSKGPKTVTKVNNTIGSKYLSYRINAHSINMSFLPTDFVQINQKINQKMINQAIEWLNIEQDDVILDL